MISNTTAIEVINYRIASEIDDQEDEISFTLDAIDDLVMDGSISRVQANEITTMYFGHPL